MATKKKKAAKKPTPSKKKPVVAKKKPVAAKKKPVATKKKPVAAKQKPVVAKQKPVAKKKPADASVSAAATELIELERELYTADAPPGATERWMTLVNRVLGSSVGPHPRRSVRLPAELPVRLGIRKGEFTCQLTDVSHLGVTVEGAVLAHISMDDTVEIRSLETADGSQPIGVRSTVVRIDGSQSPAVAGLSLSLDNDDEARRRYFDEIYYPLYLAYLDERARS
jgi:hypothetical protein